MGSFFHCHSLSFGFRQWHCIFYLTSLLDSARSLFLFLSLFWCFFSPIRRAIHPSLISSSFRWRVLWLRNSNNILWKFGLIRKFEYKFEACIINTWAKIEDFDRKLVSLQFPNDNIICVNETVTSIVIDGCKSRHDKWCDMPAGLVWFGLVLVNYISLAHDLHNIHYRYLRYSVNKYSTILLVFFLSIQDRHYFIRHVRYMASNYRNRYLIKYIGSPVSNSWLFCRKHPKSGSILKYSLSIDFDWLHPFHNQLTGHENCGRCCCYWCFFVVLFSSFIHVLS